MTSINAIRFNHYSGACVCDESISTSGDMKIYVGDKIRPCIPKIIIENYGIVGAIGTTGSCALGDEIKHTFYHTMLDTYESELDKKGKKPDKFKTVEEMNNILFNLVISIKNKLLNNHIKGLYGFSMEDLIRGYYEKNDKKIEIKDKDTIKEVIDMMLFKYTPHELEYIFNNAGIFVGYDDIEGFQIYHFDLRDAYWHLVQSCYLAEGSGRHSVDPRMYAFVENLTIEEKRTDIDPVFGIISMISALNSASDHEIGVGGYFNITLIDGKKEFNKRLIEVNDDRSHLAAHIVRTLDNDFINYDNAYELINRVLFKEDDFDAVYNDFWKVVNKPDELCRILRGYKVMSYR